MTGREPVTVIPFIYLFILLVDLPVSIVRFLVSSGEEDVKGKEAGPTS